MSKICFRFAFAFLLSWAFAAAAPVRSHAEPPNESGRGQIVFAQILLTGTLPELEGYLERLKDRSAGRSLEVSDLNAPTFGPWSPLCLAAARGRAEIVHRLLEAGASIKVPCTISQPYSPLLLAAYSGSLGAVRVILESRQMSPEVLEQERLLADQHDQRNLGLVLGAFQSYLKLNPSAFHNPNLESDEGIGPILNANCSICQKYFLEDVLRAKCCKQTLCISCANLWSDHWQKSGVTCPFCRSALTSESLSRASPFDWIGPRPEFFDSLGWPLHFPRPRDALPSGDDQPLPSAPPEDQAPLPSAPPFEAITEKVPLPSAPPLETTEAEPLNSQVGHNSVPIWQLEEQQRARDQFFEHNKRLIGQFFGAWHKEELKRRVLKIYRLEFINLLMDVTENPNLTLEGKRAAIENLRGIFMTVPTRLHDPRKSNPSYLWHARPLEQMRPRTIELVNWIERNPSHKAFYSFKKGPCLRATSSQMEVLGEPFLFVGAGPVIPVIDFLELPERFRSQREPQIQHQTGEFVRRQTKSGAVYTQVLNHPKLGTAWQDPQGLLWSDQYRRGRGGAILEKTWMEARKHCFNLNGKRKADVIRAFESREAQMRPLRLQYVASRQEAERRRLYGELIALSKRQPEIAGCYLPSHEELASHGVDLGFIWGQREFEQQVFSEHENRWIWSGSAQPHPDALAFAFSDNDGYVVDYQQSSLKAFRCVCGAAAPWD